MARVALVTGGTRGIGKAISARLKADGFKVAANYAGNSEAADATAKELGVSVYKWDVGDEAQCAEGIAKVASDLGPVDILVNNAGITRDGQFHKMSAEKWRDVIRVDLDSLFYMTRPVIEGMRDRGFGRIVNISSINGQKGQFGQVNYSAAKAGMIGFTKALAQESAAKGVTVNCVCPGYIDTDMVAAVPEEALKKIIATIPVGRLGKAEEIAHAVSFLASDGAAFMTGATLTMNGAQYIAG
jgi:acetoacetyl-CoA reductase